MGDAWTNGILTGTETPIAGGYRSELYSRLTADGSTVQFVGTQNTNPTAALTAAGQAAHDGIPGIDTGHLAEEIVGYDAKYSGDPGFWLEGADGRAPVDPDITVLLIGTNDLQEGVGPWSIPYPGPTATILQEIYAARPNTHVYLCEVPPITAANTSALPNETTAASLVPTWNSYLPCVVTNFQSQGYAINLVDTHDVFLNSDGSANSSLFFDGVHPNQTGYNLLGDTIANAIQGIPTISATNAVQVFNGSLGLVNRGKGLPYIIDVQNGGLIDHNGSLSAVTAAIAETSQSSYNEGLLSTAAFTDESHLTTIGVMSNASPNSGPIYTTFCGQPVSATDILAKYTYVGDANLDGQVDGSDYTCIDNGFHNNLTGWQNGDFNYDGVIDGSDYTLIDNAFNTQTDNLDVTAPSQFATITSQIGDTSSVPGPSALTATAIAAANLLTRRRRCSPRN